MGKNKTKFIDNCLFVTCIVEFNCCDTCIITDLLLSVFCETKLKEEKRQNVNMLEHKCVNSGNPLPVTMSIKSYQNNKIQHWLERSYTNVYHNTGITFELHTLYVHESVATHFNTLTNIILHYIIQICILHRIWQNYLVTREALLKDKFVRKY